MIGDESVWVVSIVYNRQEGSQKLSLSYVFNCRCLRVLYLKGSWDRRDQRVTEVLAGFPIEYVNGIALLVNGPRVGDRMEWLDRVMAISW